MADGGLDRDNCYFNDANAEQANIFDGSWDMTQRKVVNYDDTFADQKEIAMGHGTYVSGIIAGKKSSNGIEDEIGNADGKLSHIPFEVEKWHHSNPFFALTQVLLQGLSYHFLTWKLEKKGFKIQVSKGCSDPFTTWATGQK